MILQRTLAAHRSYWLIVLLISAMHARVAGQSYDPIFSSQARSDQIGPLGIAGQETQYPICTPADYGDPTAACVPPAQMPLASSYRPYGDTNDLNSPALEPPNTVTPLYNPSNPVERARFGTMSRAPNLYVKEPPTEFQRYVAAATGVMLPIFGASLFEQVPATFAPVDRIPVSPNYIIAPGDELQLTIWGQVNLFRRLIVDRTGQVTLPDCGPISVAGLNYSETAAVFRSALAHVYKNFDVSVTLGRLHSIQIFVVGEARRPGSYTVSSLSTLVNAVFISGGPSARGSMRNIQLKRGGATILSFDLYDLLLHGDKSKDAQLRTGDVIFISPAGHEVAVAGSVEHPAIYEVKDGDTLSDILRLCDGLSPIASAQEAILDRVSGGAALEVDRIQLEGAGLQTKLRNGDIIQLLSVVPRFENAVTLRGNVANPGRFPWHSGMRVSDLIPNKESLLTRDYWKERNRLAGDGLSGLETESTQQDERQPGATSPKIDGVPTEHSNVEITSLTVAAHQPAYREQERNLHADSSLGAATGGDHVPPIRDFLPHNVVQPAAPEIDWDYAVIERIDKDSLGSRIVPFRLGDLVLRHDLSQDLPLEPGDVVTIFSEADFSLPRAQQAKQVRVEGEVAMAGVYTLAPGETLRELVERAGGLTKNAYLYGAQFTRDSTRREQQKRYDDFLNQLDREMAESAATLGDRAISPQQVLAAQTSASGQRDLIDRLRKISMDGRIVLGLDPTSRGVASLPDLPLENGDRLYVPSQPSTVNVMGAVFEQATFLYEEDLRVGDYLKKAGGPMRSADRSRMFIVRADGSVVSKTSVHGVLFATSFETLPIFPGDTLVIPTYINKATFARSLMDWSQIFGNLALGAAAVNVLH